MPAAVSSQMTLKRINREIADVAREDLGAITLGPTDSLFVWKGSIPGPAGSPYEKGVFGVDVALGSDYPFSAPKVTFSTRIYHMNVSDRGQICMDILKNNWSPALSLFKVMLSLSSLLTDPNPQDPLVPSIATEFVRNRTQHDKTARQWTELYAKPPKPAPAPSSTAPTPTATNINISGSSSSSPAATRPNRNKGKERAILPRPPPTTISAPPHSSSPSQKQKARASDAGPIIIDSDSEPESDAPAGAKGKGKKRKRTNGDGGANGSRAPDVDGDVVDLTGDGDEEISARRKGKRRAVAGLAGASAAGVNGEIIVIDD